MFFHISIPFIHSYSVLTQVLILLVLLTGSYLHRTTRLVLAGLASAFLAFKVLVPVVGLLFWAFKGIAMMGFYIHYFQVALGFMVSGGMLVLGGVEWFAKEMDKARREREAQDGSD